MGDDLNRAFQNLRIGDMIPPDPPADIFDHVPAGGGAVALPIDRTNVLLTSTAVITALIGAGFVFMQKLFEDSGYDLRTLITRPTWAEYMNDLEPTAKQRWCANTAHYVNAMRTNTQLEIITDENGYKKIKPLLVDHNQTEGSMILTPASFIRLIGNETIILGENGKMVYKHDDGPIFLPDDPVDISAFCMANFFHKEGVQVFMNWGPDFQLISEEEVLRTLGESSESDQWKTRVVSNILKNALGIYKTSSDFNEYIMKQMRSVRNYTVDQASQVAASAVELRNRFPQHRDTYLLKLASEQPFYWMIGNYMYKYPMSSAFLILFLIFHFRREIDDIKKAGFRFFGWLTGQNPDVVNVPDQLRLMNDQLRLMNGPNGGPNGGGKKSKATKTQKKRKTKVVIVINNSLSDKHIEKLFELFGKKEDIDSFSKEIKKNLKKITTIVDSVKKGFNSVRQFFSNKLKTQKEVKGGKRSNKKSTKRRKQYRHKTQKR